MGQDRQLGFPPNDVFLEKNLRTGEVRLKKGKRPKKARESLYRNKQIIDLWWNQKGRSRFIQAAQGWVQEQSVQLAEDSGQSVEYISGEMASASTEGELRKAIKETRFKPIRALDIATKFRVEATIIRAKNPQFIWIEKFLIHAVEIVSEEFHLNTYNTMALKAYVQQPRMSGF